MTEPDVVPAATQKDPAAPTGAAAKAALESRESVPGSSLPRTRAAAAWTAICVAALVAVALIIFLAQNTATVPISFLWMHVEAASLTVALLIAAVGGILLTCILGMARIVQLRRLVRRGNE